MNKLRLLIVEDRVRDLDLFSEIIDDYKTDNNCDIESVPCKSLDEALKSLDNTFDGAIIDIRLSETENGGKSEEGGNKVIQKIIDSFYRIPVAVYTANPKLWDETLEDEIWLIEIFIKGDTDIETNFVHILDRFWEIYNTGLTRIMGGRGEIERKLNQVFIKNLLPQIKTWVSYGETYKDSDSKRTERALLRYTLNHLHQQLEDQNEKHFPEEFYLSPPATDKIITGSIVNANDQWYVVLSPACDLVIRKNGKTKTDRILFVEVEYKDDIVNKSLNNITKKDKKKSKLQDVFNNNYTDYYHWLPKTDVFEGGFLNFRKLHALDVADFSDKFGTPEIQVSPSFIKDIVSRFSSYYARQGQPEIDNKDFIDRYTS